MTRLPVPSVPSIRLLPMKSMKRKSKKQVGMPRQRGGAFWK